MIESDMRVLTADALQAVLRDYSCQRMFRAWRNRSPVTHSQWYRLASSLLSHTAASAQDCYDLAAALYCACGQVCDNGGMFEGFDQLPDTWPIIAELTQRHIKHRPEKALSRGEYEARTNQAANQAADVCHQLYRVLQVWRTGKAGERADIWTITRAAETAYHSLFPNRGDNAT